MPGEEKTMLVSEVEVQPMYYSVYDSGGLSAEIARLKAMSPEEFYKEYCRVGCPTTRINDEVHDDE